MPNTPDEELRYQRDIELDDYLQQCVKIQPEDIQGEFIRIPADLAYWNARFAKAMREYLMKKIDLDIIRARLQPIVRESLKEAGGKTTEAQVDAAIEAHPRYIEASREVVEAEVRKAELYGNLDAIRAKKDMLMSLGAHLRVEMEHDPILREQVRAQRLMKEGG